MQLFGRETSAYRFSILYFRFSILQLAWNLGVSFTCCYFWTERYLLQRRNVFLELKRRVDALQKSLPLLFSLLRLLVLQEQRNYKRPGFFKIEESGYGNFFLPVGVSIQTEVDLFDVSIERMTGDDFFLFGGNPELSKGGCTLERKSMLVRPVSISSAMLC